MQELGGDLEVPADTLEGALVVRGVALERGEEVGGVHHVDLPCLGRVWEDVVEPLYRLDHVRLEVPSVLFSVTANTEKEQRALT